MCAESEHKKGTPRFEEKEKATLQLTGGGGNDDKRKRFELGGLRRH